MLPCDLESQEQKLDRLRSRFTPEQRLFADSYLDSGDCEDAYEKAYGKHNRSRAYALLDSWYIRDYIAAVLETENSDAHLITRSEVLSELHRAMVGAEKDADRIKAAEVLLRECGTPAPPTHQTTVQIAVGMTPDKISEIRKTLGIPVDK